MSSTNVKFSIETLREKDRPVVRETFEFEIGDKSKLLASFGTFGLSKLRAIEEK